MAANEADSMLRILGGQLLLILACDPRIDHLVTFDQGQMGPASEAFRHGQMGHTRVIGPHVIGIGKSEILVKAVL